MAFPHTSDPSSNDDEKPSHEFSELAHTVTVPAVPQGVKVGAGSVLDSEGFRDTSSTLQLASDGHTVLLPQPTSDPNDPLNWSWTKKHLILFTVAWAALNADFTSASGPTVIFAQASQWGVSPNIANQPNAINVLFGGLGGLIWVPMSSFWGRAPVLFWTSIAGFAVTIGTAVSPTYECYFAMRVLTALFLTSGQTMSIAVLRDMFFFHERARKIGLWAALYIASPYLGPCLSNFVIHETHHWPNIYWLCTGVVGLQIILVVAFVDETWYNRDKHSYEQPVRHAGVASRISRLIGIWQFRSHKAYFPKTLPTCKRFAITITKPAFSLICLSYFLVFAWAIGINISTTILFAEPKAAGGYGFSNKGIGFLYFTPIGGVFLGEIFGHFFNDYMARRYIHRHKGVFQPEVRLWMIYISIIIMAPGLVLLGQALQHHLNVAAIVFGWGMFNFGLMTMSVAVTAYALDSYPTTPAELGGWINFARTFGGFSVGYFQSPWERRIGAAASFGTQAAIVAVAAVPVIVVHIYGRWMRRRFGEIG